jgi:hypothetical protein
VAVALRRRTGHTDIKTTMIYVSLGKSHIREQVERLNAIPLLPLPTQPTKIFGLATRRSANPPPEPHLGHLSDFQ